MATTLTTRGRFGILAVVLLIGTLTGVGQADPAPDTDSRVTETRWLFKGLAPNSFSDPNVSRFYDSFDRTFPDEPKAEALTDFPEMLIPEAAPGQNHAFTVDVAARILPGADTSVQGFRPHDAILIINGSWPNYRPYVGVGVNCVTDIWGNPLGCTPPAGEYATNSGVFSVSFPFSVPSSGEFRFGVGALNCAACLVEYVYEAKQVEIDPNERCFGSKPTVRDWDGDGRYVGTPGDDVFFGTGLSERFIGNGGDDKICARGGNDRIVLGPGSSNVSGGSGVEDVLVLTSEARVRMGSDKMLVAMGGTSTIEQDVERVVGSPADDTFVNWGVPNPGFRIDGGGGTDTIDYSDEIASVVAWHPDGGRAGQIDITSGFTGHVATFGLERILGGSGNDRFIDSLATTFGGAGNDELHLGAGQRGFGGAGKDILALREPGVRLVNGGSGRDALAFLSSWPGGATVSLHKGVAAPSAGGAKTALENIEGVVGTEADDTIIGDRDSNGLAGLGGSDTIDGYRGRDKLVGGPGADVLRGSLGNDLLDGGPGRDWALYTKAPFGVEVSISKGVATGGHGTDRLVSIENLRGSRDDDRLVGDNGVNVFRGGGGTDLLAGGPGDDRLFGEEGVGDVANGGRGTDTCVAEVTVRCER